MALLLLMFVADRTLHQGKVVRGVSMAGVRLGGLSRSGVVGALLKVDSRLAAQPLTVKVRAQTFALRSEKVSLGLDVEALADDAMQLGRDGGVASQFVGWLGRLVEPAALPLAAKLDTAALLAEVVVWERAAIDDPAFEGAIVVEDGRALAKPPRPGWAIDRTLVAAAVMAAYCEQERQDLPLALVRNEPQMESAAVEQALERARGVIRADVTLSADLPPEPPSKLDGDERRRAQLRKPKEQPAEEEAPRRAKFVFPRTLLGRALTSQRSADGSKIELSLAPAVIDEGLAEARKAIERPAISASFEVGYHDQVRIVPGRSAASLDAAQVALALEQAAAAPTREGELPVKVGPAPALTSEGARRLNISGLVSEFTTHHPCCQPRVKNIHRIADTIDGVILRPGEVFSINEFVGPRTVAKGYFPAPTIVEGEMEDTIGGGISQFATTFFNAAFYGGYDVIERQPHSYYFRRYPRGIEATLSFPKPDVIIRNDSASGLLIKTYYSGSAITVKMYGHNDGRKVTRTISRPVEPTEPPLEYIADDTLDPDETKTKERGAGGWSLYVTRVITFKDGAEKKETRKVTYKPRVRRIRVHSCRIPEGKDGHTGKECPKKEEDDEDKDKDKDKDKDGGSADPPDPVPED